MRMRLKFQMVRTVGYTIDLFLKQAIIIFRGRNELGTSAVSSSRAVGYSVSGRKSRNKDQQRQY
jgi:hypothetical protein